MNLNELQPAEGSKFAPKRVGRGIGSGTCLLYTSKIERFL